MPKDRSWVLLDDHRLEAFQNGCVEFLDFAFAKCAIDNKIRCPCRDCKCRKFGDRDFVHKHLLWRGWDKLYGKGRWRFHLESEEEYDAAEMNDANAVQIPELLVVPQSDGVGIDVGDNMNELLHACLHQDQQEPLEEPIPEADDLRKLIEEWCIPLYDGCREYSKLSFIMEFYKIKSRGKMSDKTFTETLQLMKKIQYLNIPDSFYEVKKLIGKLGCGYVKIDACENDCMLFWKDDLNLNTCKVCNASRWRNPVENEPSSSTTQRNRVPKKVLWHFPLIPRLKRLFICEKTAVNMRWHVESRCNDGILRHPADSDAWKEFDKKHESFSLDPRNVRLGLATDGFNPFGSLSSKYSAWPVILMIYNLPPNMCMQRSHMMMSLLISGPKGPKNGIDVYLQPLIDELNELWASGIPTFDASTKCYFNLRAALLWTINDFPAFGNLSGWSTSGYLACPSCAEDTVSERLYKSNKQCYMGHSRFPEEGAPPPPSGDEVLSKTEGINVIFGAGQAVHRNSQWRKRSIFFELPYWKDNLIRHNLDVMHIEKNIGELLLKWLLNILGRNDGFDNAKEDIEKIKKPPPGKIGPRFPTLVPKLGKYHKMSTESKKAVCDVIANIKVPNGYASNIARCVNEDKVGGLKSHDYHVLMQQLLPLAIRNVGLPKKMASTIIRLCNFFRELCSKTNKLEDFRKLHSEIVKVLCDLEKLFPPAFFVVMMHLPVHLAHEAMVAGPVNYRWMYPIERYLGHLKTFVRNKKCPEGSIAECYITEECLNFCALYTESSSANIRDDEKQCSEVRPKYRILSYDEMEKAHNYCLFNTDEVQPYIEEHFETIKNKVSTSDPTYHWRIQQLQDKEFRHWFQSNVQGKIGLSEDLKALARSPQYRVQTFKRFEVQGFMFRTKSSEESRYTQNSGVFVKAQTTSFASAKDKSPKKEDVGYYGVIKDIIEVSFGVGTKKVVLFECDWANIRMNKTDSLGFTLVNLAKPDVRVSPFVLPSQVLETFYVEDPRDRPWMVPIVIKPRDNFALRPEDPSTEVEDGCYEILPINSDTIVVDDMEE